MTDRFIQRLNPRQQAYSKRAGRGLVLWVYPSGRKTWRFRARVLGRPQSVTVGHWPQIKAEDAKSRAKALARRAESGLDLHEEYRRRRWGSESGGNPTVREFGKEWIEKIVAKARKDVKPVERYLDREVYPTLGKHRVRGVTSSQTQKLIFRKRDQGKPEAAAALRHVLKRLFDYARACQLVRENPVEFTPLRYVTQHKQRKRTLSEAELRIFLRRSSNPGLGPLGIALQLLLLTMTRKGELRQARWEYIDFERGLWEIPPELSKSRLPHIVYLSRQALALFARLKEFAGRAEVVLPQRGAVLEPIGHSTLNKLVGRIEWGIPHFTPHDLRRTASTLLNEQGYEPDWIERALNHVDKGVRGTYNRAQYASQRKRMLQEWADWLERL